MIKNEFLKQLFAEEQHLGSAPKEFIAAGFLSAYTGLLATSEDLEQEEKILEKAETTLEYLRSLINRNGTKLDDKHVRSLVEDIINFLKNSYEKNTHDRKNALLPTLNLGVRLYQDIYSPNKVTLNQAGGLQNCCELYEKSKELLEEMQKKIQEKDYIIEEIPKLNNNSLKQQDTTGAKFNTSPSGEKLGSKVLNETRLENLAAKSFRNSRALDNIEYLENNAPEIVDLFNQGEISFSTAISVARSFDTSEERLEAIARSKNTKKSINSIINTIKRKSAALGNANEEFDELPETVEIFQKPGLIILHPLRFWENEEMAQEKLRLISAILNTPQRDIWYVHDTDESSEEKLTKLLKEIEKKIKVTKYDINGKKID